MSSAEMVLPQATRTVRRFAITWRNRLKRHIAPVAVLDDLGDHYRFQYLDGAEKVDGFRPLVGFPDFAGVYTSKRLWPFFELRAMDRKRPDFAEYASWLGLTSSASTLDILSRSGGGNKGDSFHLVEAPTIASDGETESIFLARGVRYALDEHGTAAAAAALQPGDKLQLGDDFGNEANPRAVLLQTCAGESVGWVPDLLADYARELREGGGTVQLVQNNREAPPHARLLVRLSGRVTAETRPFVGGVWPPFGFGAVS
ncbi:hypothetical protein [Mycobacteroides chelonae]|uniref:hypothetical protein n=1 Tax=Mycobacteroides chelonae TaxID=1774 RepID=UPI000991C382|nr:hypothetical protein [Mycobacteroides chelonae]